MRPDPILIMGVVFCFIWGTVLSRFQERGWVENGVVSFCVGIFYGLGLNFDGSEMIYINIHQQIKEMMTNY